MANYLMAGMLLLVSINAFASDWVSVSTGPKVEAFVDNDSIRFRGSTAKIWVKWVYEEPQKVEYSYPEKQYKFSTNLELYKCVERTNAIIQVTQYAEADGSDVVGTYQIEGSKAQFSEIAPDTMGEAILQWVCKKRPKQKK